MPCRPIYIAESSRSRVLRPQLTVVESAVVRKHQHGANVLILYDPGFTTHLPAGKAGSMASDAPGGSPRAGAQTGGQSEWESHSSQFTAAMARLKPKMSRQNSSASSVVASEASSASLWQAPRQLARVQQKLLALQQVEEARWGLARGWQGSGYRAGVAAASATQDASYSMTACAGCM
jgi:hypothetical protein